MSSKSEPDKVTRGTEFTISHHPFMDKTTIHKDDKTYTGYGWDREQADKNAGDKYRHGDSD